MTSSRRRRMGTAWLLSPLAAGALALGTDWAVQHDPLSKASAEAHSAQPAATSGLRHQARLAAHRLRQSEVALARLKTAERQRSDQLTLLTSEVRAVREARRTGGTVRLPSGRIPAAPPAATPAPARISVPPAPSVNATTGAS